MIFGCALQCSKEIDGMRGGNKKPLGMLGRRYDITGQSQSAIPSMFTFTLVVKLKVRNIHTAREPGDF